MAATLALMLYPLQAVASPADSVKSYTGLTSAQRADLRAIARDTWNFYSADVDPNTGQPIVTLQFTGHGSQEFKRITRAEYNRGLVNAAQAGRLNTHGDQAIISRYAGHNAIVFDGQLEETPYIDYTDPALSQGIVGNAQITEPNPSEASRTALVLQTGSLPYSFQQVGHTSCPR